MYFDAITAFNVHENIEKEEIKKEDVPCLVVSV